MKTFWGVVVAVVVAVLLTGCGEVAVPAGAHRTGVAVERTWTPTPAALEIIPVEADAEAEPAPVDADAQEEDTTDAVEVVTPPEAAPSPAAPPVNGSPPVDVAPAAPATPTVNPFDEWMANPTFTCDPGFAPGWINEQGVPTSCVAN
ncbi:hypothetical protein E3T37_03665 [Cryobacterium sp. TMT2-10]|uniref:hypothetical protein n=1 Tax=Cryobacterium sp. TMT2-10 TaxID=1259244 RepID=UPI00106B5BE1|nr:hypothetical protein [Cryobacterium sp. TMT2-10]TFD41762.1 hypothetical protein E3T37_03665 [Cryobacterium sp. TMT2-10]